jgi:hypothetical protein
VLLRLVCKPAMTNPYAPQSSEPEPFLHVATGFLFPTQLGLFSRQGILDYEATQRGAGVGIVYEAPTCRADIFVYNDNIAVATGIGDQVIAAFHEAVKGVLALKQGVIYLGSFVRQINARRFDLPALSADFVIPRGDGEMLLSSLSMVGLRDHFIKIRATVGGEGTLFAGFLDALLWELGGLLAAAVQEAALRFPIVGIVPRESDDAPAGDTPIRGLYRQISDLSQIARAWESLLHRSQFDADTARATPPFFNGRSDEEVAAELGVWQRYVEGQIPTRKQAVEQMLKIVGAYYKRCGMAASH